MVKNLGDGRGNCHYPHDREVMQRSLDSVSDATEELKAKGIEVVAGPHDNQWCASAAIKDPDGNLVLLHQRHDGTVG